MILTQWFVVVGIVLILMALSGSLLTRLPISTSLLYLLVGVLIGPLGFGMLRIDPVADAAAVELITEVVVIVSLFAAGLKLRIPLRDPIWRLPIALASWSMTLTVALLALVGVAFLGLAPGAAVLLGAILAPTDPVLASDVQVNGPRDRDRLRFTLTGEAGLNDGTAFPFVMLGLGMLGLEHGNAFGWRWLGVDVIWATAGGLAIGALLGTGAGLLILHLRKTHQEAVGFDDFLALGLIALTYGAALLLHTYGFLAVFAAGLALRGIEERSTGQEREPDDVMADADTLDEAELATHPEAAPVFMIRAVLGFTEQLERIGEVAVMLLIGSLLSPEMIPAAAWWFVPLLLLVIRPAAVALGVIGSPLTRLQRAFIAWFGVRGVGSIYYLMYAIAHGVGDELSRDLTGLTLAVVAASVVVHGVSVTPLMARYERVMN